MGRIGDSYCQGASAGDDIISNLAWRFFRCGKERRQFGSRSRCILIGDDGDDMMSNLAWRFFRFGKDKRQFGSRSRCWSNISYLVIVIIVVIFVL